tara:strand:- start:385 stop:1521 length:1137 start_codon:yes stop_codon:yes gene_type:complete
VSRKRSKSTDIPKHIDHPKLPNYCYWDKSGKGHWYTQFKEDGKWRRRKVGDEKSLLSDLHKEIEKRIAKDFNTLSWLFGKFKKSPAYKRSKSQIEAWDYAFGILDKHPTLKAGITLAKVPLNYWNPELVQKTIDSVGESNGATAAKRVREFISRMFNWGSGRGHCQSSPVGKPEMPAERKQQRIPETKLVKRLELFAKERGSQARTKGSCSPYIFSTMVIARKCRLRGVETRTATDAHLLDIGIDCQRRKGSRTNVTEYDELLEEAIGMAIDRRNKIFEKKSRPIPFKAEDRFLIVGTSGQPLSKSSWSNAWSRFLSLAIEQGIMTKEEWFGLHDLKRRGVTDTSGTIAERMEASGHKSLKGFEPYDKRKSIVSPSPD